MVWKESDALMAAYDVLTRLGIDPPELQLLRFGENALFALHERSLILRVSRPQMDPGDIARMVEFVRRVAARGMPVSEPVDVPGLAQPVVTSTGIVTLWAFHDVDPDCRVTAGELGAILRRFHELAAPEAELVDMWKPFGLIGARLAAAERDGIPRTVTAPLRDLLGWLELDLAEWPSALGTGVIHADMHYGNVLCLPGHRLLLIDFDQVCLGPREWDLVPNLVTFRRFGLPDADYRAFSRAYGFDLRASPLAKTFVALRELGMTSWLLQQYGLSAQVDAEIELRVATITEPVGPPATRWTAR